MAHATENTSNEIRNYLEAMKVDLTKNDEVLFKDDSFISLLTSCPGSRARMQSGLAENPCRCPFDTGVDTPVNGCFATCSVFNGCRGRSSRRGTNSEVIVSAIKKIEEML